MALGTWWSFVGNMTGKANIKFVCRLYGKTKSEMSEIVNFVKDFSELGDYFDIANPNLLFGNEIPSKFWT